ncbi:DNA/RNA-binding protein ALBA1 isoform X1 [Procambarus clarkii]|uniref:DNA/RNA-binding protein ALBA1 isoform X1 n=1 Tax=Procambarus clarkii TaxID=6728 RepID=UPI003744115B
MMKLGPVAAPFTCIRIINFEYPTTIFIYPGHIPPEDECRWPISPYVAAPIYIHPNAFIYLCNLRLNQIEGSYVYYVTRLKTDQQQLWIGSGPAAVKAVSCVEVIKKRIANLHQITRLVYKNRVEEYWEPKLDGLDRLRVVREVPTIVILLSKDPLDSSVFGYQAPGTLGDDFCKFDAQQKRRHKEPRGRHENRNGGSSNHRSQNVTGKFRGYHDGGHWEGGNGQREKQRVNERGRGGHRRTVESKQRFGGGGASDGSVAGGDGGAGGDGAGDGGAGK